MPKRFALFAVALAILGCGGGGGGSATTSTTGSTTGSTGGNTTGGGGSPTVTGQVSFTWAWRSASRIIPAAANSMVLSLTDASGAVVASGTVADPVASWTSPSIQTGIYTLSATAYPSTNGSGVAQATGSASVTVTANQTATAYLVLASTVTAVTVTGQNTSVAGGSQLQLTATATNAQGATVVVAPSTITWATSNANAATVDSNGLVTGVQPGSANITATFTEVATNAGQTPVGSAPYALTVAGGSTTVTLH